jgi:UDP-glucose 4-epimerase
MGFVGLHTIRRFLDNGDDVIATQHTTRREPEFLKADIGKKLSIEAMDITDAAQVAEVVSRTRPDSIVHLAAPRPNSMTPSEEYHLNFDGLINILDAAVGNGVPRVQVASSQTVYRGVPAGPFNEDMPLPTESAMVIEAHKKAMEILALYYAAKSEVEVVTSRLGGIYGPLYQTVNHPIARMCHAAVKGVPADFGAQAPFAEEARGYCYVKDCAAGVQLLQSAETLPHKIYNISGGIGSFLPNGQVADCVRNVVPEADITLQEGSGPASKPNAYLDVSRAAEDVGFTPQYDIQAAVADYIEWLRTNEK